MIRVGGGGASAWVEVPQTRPLTLIAREQPALIALCTYIHMRAIYVLDLES
jgi:hypothetical protein